MIVCDLCSQAKECLQKEIDGKGYDICPECWRPLAEKLHGKGGRVKKNQETVFLPPPSVVKEREDEEQKPRPGEPPKIWGRCGNLAFNRVSRVKWRQPEGNAQSAVEALGKCQVNLFEQHG